MKGIGRYSALHVAHRRVQTEKEARGAAIEMTDRQLERRDRDQAKVPKAAVAEHLPTAKANTAEPNRATTIQPRTLSPEGPPPGESVAHYVWRQIAATRIAREQARQEAQKADVVPRILRTEKDPISRSSALKAALDRQEAERARASLQKANKREHYPAKEIGRDD